MFPDLRVREVKELVGTGGLFSEIPVSETGVGLLTPQQFHREVEKLLEKQKEQEDASMETSEPDTVLLDVRNHIEYNIGHFDGATDPETRVFSQFPAYVRKTLPKLKGKKILMYCTGGIRCEKASAYIRKQLEAVGDVEGAQNVHHLHGGIHKYLQAYPDGGLFKGLNYVFDSRNALAPEVGQSEVVGKCVECQTDYDQLQNMKDKCIVCRDNVLICSQCRINLREKAKKLHAANQSNSPNVATEEDEFLQLLFCEDHVLRKA